MSFGCDKEYLMNLIKNVIELDYLCEVTLVAGLDNEKFPVHRTIMAASSTYFQALLGPHYKEANQKEIVLNEVSGPTLKTLIHYCYTGYIKITHDNVESIMDAAASREMTPLAEKCTHFWSENIGINRCLKILLVADKYQLTDLWQKSLRYICENFEDIPIGEMVKVDGKNFGAILKQRQITAAESIIFERFVEWIQYDVANRATFVASYANLIRLCHFAGKFLSEKVEPFYEKHGCIKLVIDEYRNRSQHSKPIFSHRFSTGMNKLCCAVQSGLDDNEIEIYELNNECNSFEKLRTIAFDLSEILFTVFSNGKLFVFGTAAEGEENNGIKMESYDLLTFNKETLPDLPLDDIYYPPIVIDKYIYIFGKSSAGLTTSFIRFNTEENLQWETRSSLLHKIHNLSAVELNGSIFVVGRVASNGWSRNGHVIYLSKCWCYDVQDDKWIDRSYLKLDNAQSLLFKAQEGIYIWNSRIGFRTYDSVANRWAKLDDDSGYPDDFEVLSSIEFNDQTYVISSEGNEIEFGVIKMNEENALSTLVDSTESSFLELCYNPKSFHLFIH